MKTCRPLLILAGCSFWLTACQKNDGQLQSLDSQVEELSSSLADLKKSASKLRAELVRMNDDRTAADNAASECRVSTVKLKKDMEAMKAEFDAYRVSYRDTILKRAPGLVLGDVELAGRPFKAVRVKELTKWELTFAHSNGIARVGLQALPEELQQRFAYDPSVGPKPEEAPMLAAGASLDPSDAVAPGVTPGAPATGTAFPDPAPGAASGGRVDAASRQHGQFIRLADGSMAELIESFGPSSKSSPSQNNQNSTNGSGGSHIGPPTVRAGPGYKPIGSGMTGSSYDPLQQRQKK